jgi:7,8-dihydropterin-6-yl-methyl-4-(beta-D-ribofuranosyl)aminobenzene 5'-phosphate synthase
MKISILYDNEARPGFQAAWGFSCLIEHDGVKVLFDTGSDTRVLKHNMVLLGVKPEHIDTIVISHDHWDHSGGLPVALHPGQTVYLPASASGGLKRRAGMGVRLVEVEGAMEVAGDIHSTGEMGSGMREQSLALMTEKGVMVVTGCAHPGLKNIMEACGRWGEVRGVIGGFHDFDELGLLEGMDLIGPCHCTFMKARIRRMYPETTVTVRAGEVLEV